MYKKKGVVEYIILIVFKRLIKQFLRLNVRRKDLYKMSDEFFSSEEG